MESWQIILPGAKDTGIMPAPIADNEGRIIGWQEDGNAGDRITRHDPTALFGLADRQVKRSDADLIKQVAALEQANDELRYIEKFYKP